MREQCDRLAVLDHGHADGRQALREVGGGTPEGRDRRLEEPAGLIQRQRVAGGADGSEASDHAVPGT